MSTTWATVSHLVVVVAVIIAATILASLGHLTGNDAVLVILAAAGISSTGIAGTVLGAATAKGQAPVASVASVTRAPSTTA